MPVIHKAPFSPTSVKGARPLTTGALRDLLPQANGVDVLISQLEWDPVHNRFITYQRAVTEVFAKHDHRNVLRELHLIFNPKNGGGDIGQTAEGFRCVWETPREDVEATRESRAATLAAIRLPASRAVRYHVTPNGSDRLVYAVAVDVTNVHDVELRETLEDARIAAHAEAVRARPLGGSTVALLVHRNGRRAAYAQPDDLPAVRKGTDTDDLCLAPAWGTTADEAVMQAMALRWLQRDLGGPAPVVRFNHMDTPVVIDGDDPAAIMTAHGFATNVYVR